MPEVEERQLSVVERFRESHHRYAQMIALGCTPSMIRQQTGISHRRLTLLAADPSFQELVAVYTKRAEEKLEEARDVYMDTAISNMIRSEQQIADHLDQAEDAGELLSVNVLDKISQGRADRFGYSKHSTMRVEHDFATALDRAIARSGKATEVKQIEGVALESKAVEHPGPPVSTPLQPTGEEPGFVGNTKPRAPRSFARVLQQPIKRRRVA